MSIEMVHRARTVTALATVLLLVALPGTAAATHGPGSSCSRDREPNFDNETWLGRTYQYRIIVDTFPGYLAGTAKARNRTLERIRDGIRTWNEGRNDCGWPRFGGFNTAMIGTAGSYSGGNHEDGHSTIDFVSGLTCADTPGIVLGCASVRQLGGGVPPIHTNAGAKEVPREADVRFRRESDTFRNRRRHRGCNQRYDLWDAAAHEIGHVVGLNDLTSDANVYQTMYEIGRFCDFDRRSLGRSDYVGLKRLYTYLP